MRGLDVTKAAFTFSKIKNFIKIMKNKNLKFDSILDKIRYDAFELAKKIVSKPKWYNPHTPKSK